MPSIDGLSSIGHSAWDIGLAVRHNFRQLSYAVDDIIVQLVNAGEIQKVYQAHGLDYEKPSTFQ